MSTLVVITGPTGVGKTDIAINLARELNAEIISADSRQIYRDIPIGTAAPTPEQLSEIKHHFVGILGLDEYYSAARFETDAITVLSELFEKSEYVVMCGGSMLYVDAVCKGIDDIPTISEAIRMGVQSDLREKGYEYLSEELKRFDRAYYEKVDLNNVKRVVHAVEICRQSGVPYSALRTDTVKQRPFKIIKIGLNLPREELFERINGRVLKMIDSGLMDEVKKVYPYRSFNSLNTVGYKELFAWIDGKTGYDEAIAKIQKNTRVYAKKQLTWYKKDAEIRWFSPYDYESIRNAVIRRSLS